MVPVFLPALAPARPSQIVDHFAGALTWWYMLGQDFRNLDILHTIHSPDIIGCLETARGMWRCWLVAMVIGNCAHDRAVAVAVRSRLRRVISDIHAIEIADTPVQV